MGDRLRLLDVGCGTGLGTALLLETPLGRRIARVELLDTSAEMLERCRRRAAGWKVEHTLRQGTLDALDDGTYDLVLASSVLHHIPDLGLFCGALARRQGPGGLFLHLQDPNPDAGPEAEARREDLARSDGPVQRLAWRLTWRKLAGRLRRVLAREGDYISQVNARLLTERIVAAPLTDRELWSVTDIHVGELPYSMGDGIRVSSLRPLLAGYTLVSERSYAYFGEMESALPPALRARERELAGRRAPGGTLLAALWRKG